MSSRKSRTLLVFAPVLKCMHFGYIQYSTQIRTKCKQKEHTYFFFCFCSTPNLINNNDTAYKLVHFVKLIMVPGRVRLLKRRRIAFFFFCTCFAKDILVYRVKHQLIAVCEFDSWALCYGFLLFAVYTTHYTMVGRMGGYDRNSSLLLFLLFVNFFFFLPPAHPSTAFLTQLSTRQEDSRISTMPALSLRSVTRSGKKSHTNSYLVQSALCVPFFFVMGKNQFIRLPPLSLLLSMF